MMARIAYADPPYLRCCGLYNHYHGEPDEGCWDDIETHRRLFRRLQDDYDGFILHASSPSLGPLLTVAAEENVGPFRVMPWVKPFAAFKRNVSVAYAWEPVLIKPVRKPVVSHRVVMRDFFSHSIVMKKGFTGTKPPDLLKWSFEMGGAQPNDEFEDLFVWLSTPTDTWNEWRAEVLASEPAA